MMCMSCCLYGVLNSLNQPRRSCWSEILAKLVFILFTFQPNQVKKKKSAQNSYNAIKTHLSSFAKLGDQLTILGCFCFFQQSVSSIQWGNTLVFWNSSDYKTLQYF